MNARAPRCSMYGCQERPVTTLRAKPSGLLQDETLDFPFCLLHARIYAEQGYEGEVPQGEQLLASEHAGV